MKQFSNRSIAGLFLSLILVSQGAVGEGADRPYDVLSYEWSVTLTFEESPGPDSPWRNVFSPLNELQAEARISLRNVGPTPLTEVPLLFNRLLKPSAIETDGVALAFHQELRGLEGNESLQINYVRVALTEPLSPGEKVRISVRYGGQLMGYPEAGTLYVRETLDPDFTILRSETFCYPHVAAPTDEREGWAARHDSFDQTLHVTVPAGHIAVNGGRSVGEVTDEDRVTFSFVSHQPDSSIQIPIAPYGVIATGDHKVYHFEQSEPGARRLVAQLGKAVVLLSSWFGPPPAEHGLTIAEIPEFFGSQAGALIIQTTGAFNDPSRYSELYHELSHLWNPPDIDDTPSRWNEGLATFLATLVATKLDEEANLDEALERIFAGLKASLASDESVRGVAMKDYGETGMTGFSYRTGALLFALLREVAGEDELLAFVADYSRVHRERGSRDADFAAEMATRLGDRASLLVERFFRTPGYVEEILESESWGELRDRYRSLDESS